MVSRFSNLRRRFISRRRPSIITRHLPPPITLPTDNSSTEALSWHGPRLSLPPLGLTLHAVESSDFPEPFLNFPASLPVPAQTAEGALLSRAHLTPTLHRLRRNPWAWGVALLVHLLILAAILLVRFPPLPVATQSPPGIDVEFENSGNTTKATAPPKTQKGPPQQAQTMAPPPPPPAAPPAAKPAITPPPTPAPTATQDEIQMPEIPLSALHMPLTPPQPREHHTAPRSPSHTHTARPSHPSEQKYVFLNGMSYGNVSPAVQPAPRAPRGMNFSPPMSDSQAATASDFSIKGNAGAGWDAALTKWVQEHAYYPQAAIEQNQQGTATVEFTVDRFGHVTGIRLLSSSGSPFLDQAWFQLFADNTLPPFPPGAKSDHVVVRYTVHYQLIP